MTSELAVYIALDSEDGARVDQRLPEVPQDRVAYLPYRGDEEAHVAQDYAAYEHADGGDDLYLMFHSFFKL